MVAGRPPRVVLLARAASVRIVGARSSQWPRPPPAARAGPAMRILGCRVVSSS